MSADNYVGLHGRSPFEGKYQAWRSSEEEHCVPEHWEDLDRGICPWCGRTVEWDERLDKWVLDDTLTVLVLNEEEIARIRDLAYGMPGFKKGATYQMIERQHDLNHPFEE